MRRIQIVKTFAIPKLMFRASAISVSNDLVKEAESILNHFIWNGKDKVKHSAVISEVENGGFNMLLCQLSIGNVMLHGQN